MRITFDTDANGASPAITSSSSPISTPVYSTEGGSAPVAMQATDSAARPSENDSAINAGPPSADLIAAIQAASPMASSLQAMDGGAGPNL